MKRYDKRLEYKTKKIYAKVNKLKKQGMSGAMAEAYIYELLRKEGIIYEEQEKHMKIIR